MKKSWVLGLVVLAGCQSAESPVTPPVAVGCLERSTGYMETPPATTSAAVLGFAKAAAECGSNERELVELAKRIQTKFPALALEVMND